MKKAAFFDIDGTLYDGVVSIDFLKYLLKENKLKARDMLMVLKFIYYIFLNKLDFIDRLELNRKLYSNIKGWNVESINKTAEEFYKKVVNEKFYPEALKILNRHIENKEVVVAVTSGLINIVNPLKKHLKLDALAGTEVGSNNGRFNGSVRKLRIGKNRAEFVSSYCKSNKIDLKNSYAYSDHYSDLPMLSIVGNAVAVNPDKKLERIAKRNSWKTIRFK